MAEKDSRPLWVAALVILFVVAAPAAAQEPITIAEVVRNTPVSFEKDVLPILQKNCLACHGAADAYGSLVLETPQTILQGGDSGPAVVPGKSGESFLLMVAAHQEEPVMPPPDNDVAAKPLTPQELGLLKLWIDEGAKGSSSSNLLSPQQFRPLPLGPNPIYAVAITPDGQFTACSRANQIFIYHTPTGQLITRLTDPALQAADREKRPGMAHLDVVQSLAFNEEGDLLASGGFRTAKLWRFPRDVQRLATKAAAPIAAVAVSPDRSLMALAAENDIALCDVATGETKLMLEGHAAPVTAVQFSADGEKFYSASQDKTVRVWSVVDGALTGRIDTPQAVTALTGFYREEPTPGEPADAAPADAASPAARIEQLATGGGDNFIRLWNIPGQLPQSLEGAAEGAVAMAVSGDRQWLALAGAGGSVQLFDLSSRELIREWKAHAAVVRALDFHVPPTPEDAEAPDPAPQPLLAVAGEDGAASIWRLEGESPLATWKPGLAPLTAIAFSPDGQHVATGAEDGAAAVWRVEAEAPRGFESAGEAPAAVAAISRDGKQIAVATQAGGRPAIVVREIETGRVLRTLLGHEAPVTALAFNADGARLISGSEDKTARVWDLNDEKFAETARFAGHSGAVGGVAFNSDATQALSGAGDNSLKLWTVATGEEVADFAGHTAAVNAVGFTANNQPVSASADKTIRIWNPADGKAVRSITTPAVVEAAVSYDGARIAAAGDDKSIRLYQLDNAALLQTLAGHADDVHSLSFSLDNTRLVTADANAAHVWNVADGRLLQVAPAADEFTAASFGPTPETLLVAGAESGLRIETLRFQLPLPGMEQAVTDVLYHPASQFIYASCADGTVRGYSPANGQQAFAANHGAAVYDLALSSDNQRLASAGEDKAIKLWNPGNGAPVQPPQLTGFEAPVRSVCFSADNARVIGGSATGEMLSFSTADGVVEESLVGHTRPVVAIAAGAESGEIVSAAGDVRLRRLSAVRRLAGHSQPVSALASFVNRPLEIVSGSGDGTVRRWNAETGQALQQFNHGAPINSVAVRSDGKRVASGGANNVAILWNVENNQQVAQMKGDIRAQTRLARLTQEKTDLVAKVAAAKTVLAAAEADLPTKTQAEQQAATALAAANADVEAKSAALAMVSTRKSDAEKTAIEMAAAAQKAAAAMEAANQKALELAAKAKLLAEDAAKAAALAQSDPMSTELAKAAETAMMIAASADAEAKAAEAAKTAPTQAATQASQAAAQAAQQAQQMGTPFTQASEALTESQTAQRTAMQTHAAAKRELDAATAAVPSAKEEVTTAEALLAKVDAALTAAQEAATKSEQPIRAVAFSPDGQTLAGAGDFGAVHTWDGETGRPVAGYHGHEAAVQAIAFVSDGELISGAADNAAAAWTLNPEWRLERVIGDIRDPSILADRVTSVDFSPDGELLVTGGGVPSRSGEVKIWRVADGEMVHEIPEAHTDAVNAVAFSPDGEWIASAGSDKYVKKFSVKTGEQVLQFEGHTNHALGVAWRSGGKILASSGADGTIMIWDAETGDRLVTVQNYQKQITSVRFVGQTQFLMAASGDPFIRMHNADNGGVQRNFAGSAEYMYSVDVTPDGAVVVAGGHDSVLRVWNGQNAQPLHTLPPPDESSAAQ